jgi:transcriptional regulator with XRE-family HTH domain
MRQTLRTARKRSKLSVRELAQRAGVHKATLYRLETDETLDPSHSTVEALEKALGLAAGSLVFAGYRPRSA